MEDRVLQPPIAMKAASIRSQVRDDQIQLLIRLILDLIESWQLDRGQVFRNIPEYSRLILGTYACGFVCSDIAPKDEYFSPYLRNPTLLTNSDFKTIRRFVHYMMRCERHADCGDDLGGGAIYKALDSGCLEAIARRLGSTPEWRD